MAQYNICFLGSPGCGKGTQATLLENKYGLRHFVMGSRLRRLAQFDEDIAVTMREGRLVPSEVAEGIIMQFVDGEIRLGDHVIFDGSPRKLREKIFLDKLLASYERPMLAVVFTLPLEIARQRMLGRHRMDDQDQTISNRFAQFEAETQPVIETFRAEGRLIEVDATADVDTVQKKLVEELEKKGVKLTAVD